MKATAVEQQALLDLAAVDLEIARANRRLAEIEQATAREAVQAKLSAASERLLTARHIADELASEIERLEQDLALVDTRIAQDKSRLETSSNPRDITGIQHELVSLEKRKANLEEAELELLERREVNAADVAEAATARTTAQAELDQIDAELEAAGVKAKSGLALLMQQREKFVALVTAEQQELYNKLVGKTLPVARLEGFTCGACNLALSGATVDEIRATPRDELARCPECAAMLVTF
jgi:uncharacterized protein